MKQNKELTQLLLSLDSRPKAESFLSGFLTAQEVKQLNLRLKIVKLLKAGVSQREIANRLGVGIATVTRGSRELKNGKFEYV